LPYSNEDLSPMNKRFVFKVNMDFDKSDWISQLYCMA
jgi:hypothetical protein